MSDLFAGLDFDDVEDDFLTMFTSMIMTARAKKKAGRNPTVMATRNTLPMVPSQVVRGEVNHVVAAPGSGKTSVLPFHLAASLKTEVLVVTPTESVISCHEAIADNKVVSLDSDLLVVGDVKPDVAFVSMNSVLKAYTNGTAIGADVVVYDETDSSPVYTEIVDELVSRQGQSTIVQLYGKNTDKTAVLPPNVTIKDVNLGPQAIGVHKRRVHVAGSDEEILKAQSEFPGKTWPKERDKQVQTVKECLRSREYTLHVKVTDVVGMHLSNVEAVVLPSRSYLDGTIVRNVSTQKEVQIAARAARAVGATGFYYCPGGKLGQYPEPEPGGSNTVKRLFEKIDAAFVSNDGGGGHFEKFTELSRPPCKPKERLEIEFGNRPFTSQELGRLPTILNAGSKYYNVNDVVEAKPKARYDCTVQMYNNFVRSAKSERVYRDYLLFRQAMMLRGGLLEGRPIFYGNGYHKPLESTVLYLGTHQPVEPDEDDGEEFRVSTKSVVRRSLISNG